MKKSVLIFCGFLTLIAMLGLVFFSGAIYDAEGKHTIDTFFFEQDMRSDLRVSPPVSADDIPDHVLREMILTRFVNEYFYVLPYEQNAVARTEFKNTDGTITALYGLARNHPAVYNDWKQNVAPEIVEMSGKKFLRFVHVDKIVPDESGNLVIHYELRTWTKPNDVLAKPELKRGQLYVDVTKTPIHVNATKETLSLLKHGEDPLSAFDFEVLSVTRN